jgi:hypothetical protein
MILFLLVSVIAIATAQRTKACLLRSQHSYVILLSPERDCLVTRTRRISAHRAVVQPVRSS